MVLMLVTRCDAARGAGGSQRLVSSSCIWMVSLQVVYIQSLVFSAAYVMIHDGFA